MLHLQLGSFLLSVAISKTTHRNQANWIANIPLVNFLLLLVSPNLLSELRVVIWMHICQELLTDLFPDYILWNVILLAPSPFSAMVWFQTDSSQSVTHPRLSSVCRASQNPLCFCIIVLIKTISCFLPKHWVLSTASVTTFLQESAARLDCNAHCKYC